MRRRDLIVKTALGFGAYLIGCKRRTEPAPPPAGPFSPAQRATLSAACERILPRDADPGATDLGAADYIERELADPDVRAQFGRQFLGGLSALDRQARKKFGKPFPQASLDEQESLLAAWQQSPYSGESAFFEVLHTFTLEGAFGDPVHGGNRGGRGFLLVGFVPPPPMPGHHLLKLPTR